MKFPHTLLIQRLQDTPIHRRSEWCDYWRGFWCGYMLGASKDTRWYDPLVCAKEWQNGYDSGDRAWKREHRAPKFLKDRKPKDRP